MSRFVLFWSGAGEETRTPTLAKQILSLSRLPIPPRPHNSKNNTYIIYRIADYCKPNRALLPKNFRAGGK